MRVTVILSTFKQPLHLRRALCGYLFQTRPPDELIVADDGTNEDNREILRDFGARAPFAVRHYRHEHDGWRKNAIVNRAIAGTSSDYIILSDGDCIPRPDFIAAHERNARPKTFLAGGDYRLPQNVTDAITAAHIESGAVFRRDFLLGLGLPPKTKRVKLTISPHWGRWLDALNVSPARWGGSNASTWRADLLAVNGLDESFTAPCKDDVEMGERLRNLGLATRHIRYQAICLHLNHSREYWREGENIENLSKLGETVRTGRTRTARGIAEADGNFTVDSYGGGGAR